MKILSILAATSLVAILIFVRISSEKTDCPYPEFIRDAPAEWTTVSLDDFTVNIPYSSSWNVENAECLWSGSYFDPVAHQMTGPSELSFGRPSNNLTSIGYEYHLSRQTTDDATVNLPPDRWSCLSDEIVTPLELTVGNTTGWRYFRGGAKWCEIVFSFTQNGHTYTLERNLEPRFDKMSDTELAQIDDEMLRIIESIAENK